MGKKKVKNKYWKSIPKELRYMCSAEVRGCSHYYIGAILKYLINNMFSCDTFISGVSPYEVITWIDTVFERVFFPLEHRQEDWEAHKEEIRYVLNRSEELLLKIAPKDLENGHRTCSDKRYKIIDYAQRLTLYFGVLYMFTGEEKELQGRLKQLRLYSEQNVRYMLSHKKADEYAGWDDWGEYHYTGMHEWQIVNWLCLEWLPNVAAKKQFAQEYERYVLFLHELKDEVSSKACVRLWGMAEEHLKGIYNEILDELYDRLEDETDDRQFLKKDIGHFEKMLNESMQRCDVGSSGSTLVDNTNENEFIPSTQYPKRWFKFTKKLRKLMKNNPSLPVTVIPSLGINNDDLDCAVTCVHDYKTRKPMEKIILIHDSGKAFTKCIESDQLDLPFH